MVLQEHVFRYLEEKELFLVSIGLSRASALGLFLCAVVVDQLMKYIQDGLPIHSACFLLIALLLGWNKGTYHEEDQTLQKHPNQRDL